MVLNSRASAGRSNGLTLSPATCRECLLARCFMEDTLRIPIVCPECATELFDRFAGRRSPSARGWRSIPLYSQCHDNVWRGELPRARRLQNILTGCNLSQSLQKLNLSDRCQDSKELLPIKSRSGEICWSRPLLLLEFDGPTNKRVLSRACDQQARQEMSALSSKSRSPAASMWWMRVAPLQNFAGVIPIARISQSCQAL